MAQTFTSSDVTSTTNVFADNQSQRTNENTLRSTFSGSTQPSDPVVGQQWYDTANSKTMQYNGTAWVPVDTNGPTQVDVNNAKGSLTSLTSYLRVAHNDDGTLKSSPATAIDEFKDNALVITYLSPTSFTVPSDLTSIFTANRKVKVYLSASTAISYVTSSTFSTVTTVTLGTPVLDATVTAVKYSIIQEGMPQDYSLALAESTGYGIVSGCTLSIRGLTVSVASGVVHLANGTRKEISASTVTLDAANASNPRIDLVYITSAGAIAKVTGTAAASPSAPALPANGISVAQVSVAANASAGTLNILQTILPVKSNYGFISVKDFGAKGDGTTDDTLAIQSAINYSFNNGFPIIIIPSGTYLITDTLRIGGASTKPCIMGANAKTSELYYPNWTKDKPVILYTGGSGSESNAWIKNIYFAGSGQLGRAIQVQETNGLTIEGCQFTGHKVALYLYNDAPGHFAEYERLVRCCIWGGTTIEYAKASGADMSFHGSGLIDCSINQLSDDTLSPVVINSGCLPYNAPLDFSIWTRNSVYVINNIGGRAVFYGNIRIEILSSGGAYLCTGTTRLAGNITCNNQGINFGDLYLTDTIVMNSNGNDNGPNTTYKQRYYSGNLKQTTGAQTLITSLLLFQATCECYITFTAPNFVRTIRVLSVKQALVDAWSVTSQVLQEFNAAGIGTISFSQTDSSSLKVTLPTNSVPISFDATVRKLHYCN